MRYSLIKIASYLLG